MPLFILLVPGEGANEHRRGTSIAPWIVSFSASRLLKRNKVIRSKLFIVKSEEFEMEINLEGRCV